MEACKGGQTVHGHEFMVVEYSGSGRNVQGQGV